MSEILAPAGNKFNAYVAINAGADAIYLGMKEFSARSSAENFDEQDLKEIIKFAHTFNVKVYVAMNTLVKDSEVEAFLRTARDVHNLGADAIILSDIFLGKLLKLNYPEICLHLSTQAGVCNVYGAMLAREYGFDRVILARETNIEDIKKIAEIIETEVFVQGALCTCFSGQCYLSSFAGGNSGNRGKCKQPCRKLYSINREGFEEKSYKLSLSDLCIGDDVKKYAELGVASFKIEGRMRRPEYVSAAVKYYINIFGDTQTQSDFNDLKRTYNRGNYTKGLALGQDKSLISSAVQGHIGEFVGNIKVTNGKYICQSSYKFISGDGFKILRNGREAGGATYCADCKGGFIISSKDRLKNGDKVFVTTDNAVNKRLISVQRLIDVDVSIKIIAGSKAEINIGGYVIYSDYAVQNAKTHVLTEDAIKNNFNKTDKFPFKIHFVKVITRDAFMATSELNELRRTAFSYYFDKISENRNKIYLNDCKIPRIEKNSEKRKKTAIICKNLNKLSADIGILKLDGLDADISELADISKLTDEFKGEKFLYLPPFMTSAEIEKIKPIFDLFDGIYCDGLYGLKLSEKIKKPLFVGCGLNISCIPDIVNCNAKYIALSKELTLKEADKLNVDNAFYMTAGGLKVMDLIYCPFEKKCSSCDRRQLYELTDENGRKFVLNRYRTSECRFELYNCANLVCDEASCNSLIDCTIEPNPKFVLNNFSDAEKLKEYYGAYTKGHSISPIK